MEALITPIDPASLVNPYPTYARLRDGRRSTAIPAAPDR
jgi:hypothetical protein